MIACLVEAYEVKGDPFTGAAYRAWRTEQSERDRAARRLRKVPSYDVVWSRFGNWTNALAVVYRAIKLGKRTTEEIAASLDEILGDATTGEEKAA